MTTNDSLSTRRSIPVEVLELCIDAFVLDHGSTRDATFYRTLVSCALSSRALLSRSRHHMYFCIRLSMPTTTTRSRRILDVPQQSCKIEPLWKALTLNPSLTGCIRTLEIVIETLPAMSPTLLLILDMLEKHLRARASSPSQSTPSKPSCQTSGSSLQELTLMGDLHGALWSRLPKTFRQRIFQLLSVSNPTSMDSARGSGGNTTSAIGISCLRLSHLRGVPAMLLSTAKAPLRRVLLQSVVCTDAEDDASQDLDPENSALSRVEELMSDNCGACLDKALRGKPLDMAIRSDGAMWFSRLTRLQVCATQRKDVEWGAAVVKANSRTLKTLEVGGFSQGQVQYASMLCSQIDLGSLPHLTSLVVTTLAASTPSSPVCLFALLDTFDFARPESASASLKSIEINIRCMFRQHSLSSLDSILKPEDMGPGVDAGEVDNVDDSLEYPTAHRSESDQWTPTLAHSSIREKFQLLSHISINFMLGLGQVPYDSKEQDAEERISARLNGYLHGGIAPLKQTGVTARFKTEITSLDTVSSL